MSEQLYCDVADCDDPEHPGFARPAFRNGKCSSHVKQLQRTGETKKIAEKGLSLTERLIDVYSLYAEADSDADEARHKRQFMMLAKSLGKREIGDVIRQALERARAAGKRIGRPPKAESARVREVVKIVGSVDVAARVLGVGRATVYRHLAVSKGRVSRQPAHASPRPRRAG